MHISPATAGQSGAATERNKTDIASRVVIEPQARLPVERQRHLVAVHVGGVGNGLQGKSIKGEKTVNKLQEDDARRQGSAAKPETTHLHEPHSIVNALAEQIGPAPLILGRAWKRVGKRWA